MEDLSRIRGDCYLTVDMDGLDCGVCPGTGTPQPGGLGWWQTMRYVRQLLLRNNRLRLIGLDVVETVVQPHSQVNELAAAKMLTKIFAYHFGRGGTPPVGSNV
jgi:agmatinase